MTLRTRLARLETAAPVRTPGAVLVACRDCHGLTYRTRQESRKWDALYRRLAENTGASVADVRRFLADW